MTADGHAHGIPGDLQHLLLDRDGVLNMEPKTGWVTKPEEWAWEEGSLEAVRILTTAGLRLSVVTNQSCIGRGLVSAQVVDALHEAVLLEASAAGAEIAGFFVCPHAPHDLCRCRKPLPGLLEDAIRVSGIPKSRTMLVGDAQRDLEAGQDAGIPVALVLTGKGASTLAQLSWDGPVFQNLLDAATAIVGRIAPH